MNPDSDFNLLFPSVTHNFSVEEARYSILVLFFKTGVSGIVLKKKFYKYSYDFSTKEFRSESFYKFYNLTNKVLNRNSKFLFSITSIGTMA